MNEKTNNEVMYRLERANAALHITKGNSKLGKGIYTFSTLPGNETHVLRLKDGSKLTNVTGTCGKHCESCFDHGCYAVNSARQYHNTVVPAWAANTLLLRDGTLWAEIADFIRGKNKKYYKTKAAADVEVRQFRINVSGEIENEEQFGKWNQLAKTFPETVFAVYTKNYEGLEKFLETGTEICPNFVINISQWHGCADEFLSKHAGKFNVFEYDDTNLKTCDLDEENKARINKMPHCPAVTREGKHAKNAAGQDITCDHCGRCYRNTGTHTAVYAH